jgi:hypothetical protein
MIKPTEDKTFNEDLDLIFDNLFRIFKVKCENEENFRYRLKENICQFAEGSGYHRNCQIS